MATRIVLCPAGACPHKLKSSDRDSVVEWANAVMESGMKHNLKYTPEALGYWVGHFYEYGCSEYVTIRQILTNEFGATPAAILNADYGKKPNKKEDSAVEHKKEEIAGIDSFSVSVDEADDDGDIVIK